MESELRSEEKIMVRGQVMPRWVAEKCGIIPVTICRCIESYANGITPIPRSWVHGPEELINLFQSDRYLKPIPTAKTWGGLIYARDGFGRDCVTFWPCFIKNRI